MIIADPTHYNTPNLFIDVSDPGDSLLLKYEGMNFSGSIKLKTAASLVDSLETTGRLRPGMTIVESTSGSLGVALAQIGAVRGYEVICVVDPRCSARARQLIALYGGQVDTVATPHPTRGFLGARLERVHELVDSHRGYVWIDQYHSDANWGAHYAKTASEILDSLDAPPAVVFVGIGTAGTGMGIARYFREHSPTTRLVAIDVEGSVTFGLSPSPRYLPGLGASVLPPLFDPEAFDDQYVVTEADTIVECRKLAKRGFLLGASTGTVTSGARRWLREHDRDNSGIAVAIAPDSGEAYLPTAYNDEWVTKIYGSHLVDSSPVPR